MPRSSFFYILVCFLFLESNVILSLSVTKSGEKNKPAYEGRIKEEEQTSNLAIDGYRCRARVAYDGSGFNGFQVQTGKSKTRTIQGDLQDVLTKR